MSATIDPNPPSRRKESFPKTTTIPEGWITEPLEQGKAAAETRPASSDGEARPTPQVEDESLFTRRLDPFPKPNTIPTGWDLSEM